MAGVPDIPVVKQVVDRISDAAADAIFLGFRYLFCYKKHVDDLKSKMENVKNEEDKVKQKCRQERANGNTIKPGVEQWLEKAKAFQESAQEFSERYKNRASWTCLKCLPIPNPISRFRLGREAARTTTMAKDLVEDGEKLLNHPISDPPPIDDLPNPAVEFEDFESRKSVYGQLWEALVNEGSSSILGIYGMPGVGKTRMMEQLWKEAMEKKKFDKVVRANVGREELNEKNLQDQIAEDLNCKLDPQDNVNNRAARLKYSLMDQKKVLVIFDDVWSDSSEIPIEKIIGTEFGESSSSKGSKILLTSRKKDVCLINKCEYPVHITTLEDEEAWDLFQKTVGTAHIYHLGDDNLAKNVCAKCAGLPLLIRAVGKALKVRSPNHHVWKDALNKLEKGNFKKIARIDPQAYACVKWSIDALEQDAKLCLFLCSLFPEDADIHITTLIQFAIGSRLILDGESAIPTMVEVLTDSSLLLECFGDRITRMHDIIRDVSRFEASEDSKYKFFHVKSGSSRLTDNAGYSTSKLTPKLLRLDVEGDQVHFPEYLDPTDLNTLWLHCNNHLQQFPSDFFGKFENIGFLILQEVHSLPEHFSLQPLGKLKMLIFDGCDLRETDFRHFPKNLSTLCIWNCHLPSPLDLSTLNNLLRLDIQQEDLPEVVMVRNAISSLSRLEEMHIPNGIRFSDDANGVTPILDEISKLPCLRSLKIYFRDFEPCQGTAVFKKLSKYDISVGGERMNWEALPKLAKIIELNDVEVKGDEGIQSLLERAEIVTLRSTDVDVSSICKSNREAFTDLKELRIIKSCDPVEYIARISQDEIQHIRQLQASFSKLTMLTIGKCTAMKYLFCKSVAKCLGQLQELEVWNCDKMEAIVMDEGTSDGEIIDFSKLRRLDLEGLKSLRSFYRKNKEMHRGSADNSVISCAQFPPLFDEMVAFPSLEALNIISLENNCIWGNSVSSTSFCKLKELYVRKCRKLESVIPVSMLNRLHNLEHLRIKKCSRLRNAFPPCIARDLIRVRIMHISFCGMMTEIIGGKEKEISDTGDHDIIVFPQLMWQCLSNLENLTSFWGNCKVEFPCLERFNVYGCGEINLEPIEFGREDSSTCQLKCLRIRSNNKQMHLPCKWKLHFHNLEILELTGCWWRELKSLHFPNLNELQVSDCERSALFTISDFRSLKQIKTLKISDCDLLEEIVEDVKGDGHDEMDKKTIIELLQLDSVVFKDLPNLKSFTHGANYECYMPALKKMKFDNCGLSYLFTCFVFRNLKQLHQLVVSNCRLLEAIVEDRREDGETSERNNKIIIHSNLLSVTLDDLPHLSSFSCSESYAFNLSGLKTIHLLKCPQLENLNEIKASTEIVSVHTEHGYEAVTDLNDFITKHRKRGSNLVALLENQDTNQELETDSGIVEEWKHQEG